jgi:hypothetical protein
VGFDDEVVEEDADAEGFGVGGGGLEECLVLGGCCGAEDFGLTVCFSRSLHGMGTSEGS